jgi:hypothetical protein
MNTKTVCWIGAGILVAALAALLVFQGSHLFAQDPWGGQGGQGGQDGPGRGGPQRMMPRMGGASAMTSVGKFVFVTSGSTLIKVDGETMTVVKTLELPSPKPEDRPPREGEKGEKGW